MSQVTRELEALLAANVGDVIAAQRAYWDGATGTNGNQILLFGAGTLGRRTLRRMRRAGLVPIAFADNAEALWNTTVDGVRVLPPEEAAATLGTSTTFVVTVYNTARSRRQLSRLGVKTVVPYAWLFARWPDVFLPHGCLGHPAAIFAQATDIRRAFDLMAGEDMQRIFLAQLRWRLFMDFDCALSAQTLELRQTEYFPDDLYRYSSDEVLVDCGAFDGDTMRRFMAKRGDSFHRIYACEPDPVNRARLEAWLATLPPRTRAKVTVEPCAVGAATGKTRFTVTGTIDSAIRDIGAGEEIEVDVGAIDNFTASAPPTLVKMDVEGAELEALAGARRSIQAHTPVLAICVYHAADHLWRVPLLIASISRRYRFYLRAHAEDCWDTSCYAIPEDRLLRDGRDFGATSIAGQI